MKLLALEWSEAVFLSIFEGKITHTHNFLSILCRLYRQTFLFHSWGASVTTETRGDSMTKLFSHHITLKPKCLETPAATWSCLTCISCKIETSRSENAATESDLLLLTHLICLLFLVAVSCAPFQRQLESERKLTEAQNKRCD